MATFFIGLWDSAGKIGYSLIADVLGLAVRPLALSQIFVTMPTVQTMIEGGLVYGFISSISVVLIGFSLGATVAMCGCGRDAGEALARFCAFSYGVDGLAQLPILIWPPVRDHWHYLVSRTGMLVTCAQLKYLLPFALGAKQMPDRDTETRTMLVAVAVPCRYMSLTLVGPTTPSAYMLYGISVVLLVFAVTPKDFWELMRRAVEQAAKWASALFSIVHGFLSWICPIIRDTLVAILQHPLLVGFYERIILPIWQLVSPWFMPLAMLAVVFSCSTSVAELVKHKALSSGAAGGFDLILRLLCALTAGASCLILTLHAAARVGWREQPDPLRSSALVLLLNALAVTISFPLWLVLKLWEPFFMWVFRPVLEAFFRVLECLGRFACQMPLLSIPAVLLANVFIIKYLPDIMAATLPLTWPLQAAWKSVLDVQAAAAKGIATDSVLATLFIIAVQIGAYRAVACVLEAVRAVRGERTGHVLSLEELNDLAAAMSDPRQCARCGFGPIDHRGCSNLRTHHMEVAVSGGSRSHVSNACPRCDWFTGNLNDWPAWDGELQTPRGRAMFRQRVWCEIVVVIRASSKAFIVPYAMLLLGSRLHLPPSLSAFLALSYLIPWSFENAKLAASINSPNAYRRSAQSHQRPGGPGAGADEADCGASAARQLLPRISQSEALENLLAAVQSAIFLKEGDICSVCLEPFTDEAAAAAAGESVAASCSALRLLVPPVVVLRCGHPLHVECAEAAVSAGGARHVRCPLCREPVTLSGDASAVIFS